ncbi:hypothetical protein P8C59_008638 [Phyllachora maydis]|uniref:Uncharacterized protein n=1 Tax=Phyllachora maydis TaxID=1825666 RepID=A0AAD9MH47_9PEZI|nr:hypothetical protein P8C59_008638 [Phyllachora maydis]
MIRTSSSSSNNNSSSSSSNSSSISSTSSNNCKEGGISGYARAAYGATRCSEHAYTAGSNTGGSDGKFIVQ